MPSDVKCGLLVGIAGLLVVAILCFRKDERVPNEQTPQSAASVAIKRHDPKGPISAEPVSRKKPN